MFRFASLPIDPRALRVALEDPACGGYVAFEGWVRNHNEGQHVTRLEYEAFEALAVREGERIVAEAITRFGVDRAACVHRTGSLAIGDLAVWVGVSSGHRGEAFAACRYIIDEVKHRVPIWKKEHYANGDSGWVGCERCAVHAHEHEHEHEHASSDGAALDYSRQMALPEVGTAGQAKLAAARVLVIGAGGLGVPVLTSLAGAGVGRLVVVDGDRLESSNLHRQTLYALADVGQPKAELAAARLRALNPGIAIVARAERATAANLPGWLADCDLVIDCSDNFATKFLVNDAAVLAGKPAIMASVYQYEGQLQVYDPAVDSACLRCLWPEGTRDGLVGNCASAGVLGPVPGVLGQMQALEALKMILGLPGQLAGEVLLVDLLGLRQQRLKAPRCRDCRDGRCSRIETLVTVAAVDEHLEIDVDGLEAARARGFGFVDIRETDERAAEPLPVAALAFTVAELLAAPDRLDDARSWVLVCARGLRSHALASELRSRGVVNVYSLRGGCAALKATLRAEST